MTALDTPCTQLLRDQPDKWDQPNQLFIIERTGLGTLTLVPVDLPDRMGYLPPEDMLNEFVLITSTRLIDEGGTLSESIRGVAVMYEGWQAPDSHTEELVRRQRAGGSVPPIADMPDRREVRLLWARTTEEETRVFRLTRGSSTIDKATPAQLGGEDAPGRALRQTVYILGKLRDPANTKILHRFAQEQNN